jgi:hypothetical protein
VVIAVAVFNRRTSRFAAVPGDRASPFVNQSTKESAE